MTDLDLYINIYYLDFGSLLTLTISCVSKTTPDSIGVKKAV